MISPRFIPVRHQTRKLWGVCDLTARRIVKFHFQESQQDLLRWLEIFPDEAEFKIATLDSVYLVEPTKDWVGEMQHGLAYDQMLATK